MKTLAKSKQRSEVPEMIRPLIKACPECGSKMVRRTAKKSSKTGSQFWGCSAFPKCRAISPIES